MNICYTKEEIEKENAEKEDLIMEQIGEVLRRMDGVDEKDIRIQVLEKQLSDCREWITECVDNILYPLSHGDDDLANEVNAFGAASVKLLKINNQSIIASEKEFKRTQELEKQLEETRQKLTDSLKWESKQQKEIEELRHTRFKKFNNEECWVYQVGEDNITHSLVCPVVISAEDIRTIEKQLAESIPKSEIRKAMTIKNVSNFSESRKEIIDNITKLLQEGEQQ